MTRNTPLPCITLTLLICWLMGCNTPSNATTATPPHHDTPTKTDQQGQVVTVVIALSSVVPGGVVGHAGIAVEQTYWDFGPKRAKRLQPIKSIRSEAGPWWRDPDQQWDDDRSLNEVLADVPDNVHPTGSLIAIVRVRVTDEQAKAITAFWEDTYERMRRGDETYRLSAKQCASMVGWSLSVEIDGRNDTTDRLPRDLRLMTPTRLYHSLQDSLTHTAGPSKGQPADITLWQLDHAGMTPWERPQVYDLIGLPELPRIRLAFERVKHLPIGLMTK